MEGFISQIRDNIMDDANLKDNLSFAAFYIALYESFADFVEDRIKGLYWCGCERTENGQNKEHYSPDYTTKIEKRPVDENGNRNTLKASMLWLKDEGAIGDDDYNLFLSAKEQRKLFAHEMIDVVFRGITEEEIKMFFDLFALYRKIDRWWINEIEIPTSGEFVPGSYDENEVGSMMTEVFSVMIGVMYAGQSESLKKLLDQHLKENQL